MTPEWAAKAARAEAEPAARVAWVAWTPGRIAPAPEPSPAASPPTRGCATQFATRVAAVSRSAPSTPPVSSRATVRPQVLLDSWELALRPILDRSKPTTARPGRSVPRLAATSVFPAAISFVAPIQIARTVRAVPSTLAAETLYVTFLRFHATQCSTRQCSLNTRDALGTTSLAAISPRIRSTRSAIAKIARRPIPRGLREIHAPVRGTASPDWFVTIRLDTTIRNVGRSVG